MNCDPKALICPARLELDKLAKDAERYQFVKIIVTGGDCPVSDMRTTAIGIALLNGMEGDAAIDAAIALCNSSPTK